MNRNNPCECGSGKKYKKCCGLDSSPRNTKNKMIIILISLIIIVGGGFGFRKIIDSNRVGANTNTTFCPDCGRYH